MVTIFDMVTGEILADHSHAAGEARRPQHAAAGLVAPRLQTVAEAEASHGASPPAMPTDLLAADIGSFLGRQ